MISSPTRAELVSLIAGELGAATLASRHGISEDEVVRLRATFLEGMKAASAPVMPRRLRTRVAIAGVALLASAAFAQLTVFNPNEPALASQVNGNFNQLKAWLEQKVGTAGNNIITTGTVAASGTVTGGAFTTAGNLGMGSTTRQMINLYAGDYGIGVQGSTQYYRSGGGYAWYRGGAHADAQNASGGGTAQMFLSDSLLTVAGGIQANGTGGNVPNNCVVRQGPGNSYQASCNSGEIAVGGGGRCDNLWRLTESLPWGGPSDGSPVVNGQPATAWRAVCQVWGNAGTYTYPQMGVFAICCRK